jgi:hypothetical protein
VRPDGLLTLTWRPPAAVPQQVPVGRAPDAYLLTLSRGRDGGWVDLETVTVPAQAPAEGAAEAPAGESLEHTWTVDAGRYRVEVAAVADGIAGDPVTTRVVRVRRQPPAATRTRTVPASGAP